MIQMMISKDDVSVVREQYETLKKLQVEGYHTALNHTLY